MFIKRILVSDCLLGSGITKVTEKGDNLIRKHVNSYNTVLTCHNSHMVKNVGKREKGVIYL